MMSLRATLAAAAAVLLAWPCSAQADHVDILLSKGRRKVSVVLVRQVLDHVRGFDQFMVEEYAAPANRRTSRREMAGSLRSQLVPLGQYELYMKSVKSEISAKLAQFKKKGFAPACDLPVAPEAGGAEMTFKTSGKELRLLVQEGSRRDSVVLERAGSKKSYTLMRLPDGPPGKGKERRIRRTIAQVAVLADGRMLAVVLRKHVLPSPANGWEEEFFFFPLKRAFKNLGVKYPMPNEQCKRESTEHQEER